MTKFIVQTNLVQTIEWGGLSSTNVTKEVEASNYKIGSDGELNFYEMGRMPDPIVTFALGSWVWVEELSEKD